MARDHNKLRVFQMADALADAIYDQTQDFPAEERYELRRQLRRAALSVPTNLVEGCARISQKAYCNFCDIALGSAAETKYLLEFSFRRKHLRKAVYEDLHGRADALVRSLNRLVRALQKRLRARRQTRRAAAARR